MKYDRRWSDSLAQSVKEAQIRKNKYEYLWTKTYELVDEEGKELVQRIRHEGIDEGFDFGQDVARRETFEAMISICDSEFINEYSSAKELIIHVVDLVKAQAERQRIMRKLRKEQENNGGSGLTIQ